ncbi:TRAP transporter large permease [Chloroflexota bacterium]
MDYGVVFLTIGILLFFIAIGAPIGFGLLFSGFCGLLVSEGLAVTLQTFRTSPFESTYSWNLTVLPLFIMMGALANIGGLGDSVYSALEKWLSPIRAGSAIATIFGCAFFGATTGSSIATVVSLGRIVVPKMRSLGYDVKLAVSSVTSGGLLGILIPPSIPLVIYASIGNVSIPRLLLAAYIPGAITVIAFALTCFILGNFGYVSPPRSKLVIKDALLATKQTVSVFILIIVIFAALYSGILTATEVGAFGLLMVIILSARGLLRHRGAIFGAFKNGVTTTCMIFLMIIGAKIFGHVLTISGLTGWLSEIILSIALPPLLIIVIILLIYIPLGCILDGISMYLITLPVFLPIVSSLGYDLVWFGILMVKVVEMGLLTPPVGLNVYAMKTVVPDVSLTTIFRSVIPFLIAEVAVVSVLVLFPLLSLWIPTQAYG